MRTFAADFETTVYDGQERTDVWCAGVAELNTGNDEVQIFGDIGAFWDYLVSSKGNKHVYFHNLRFDGAFLISYFLNVKHYALAVDNPDSDSEVEFIKTQEMPNKSFKYIISDMGQWYSITVKDKWRTIEIRDSLKLLPFTLKQIGDSFKTKHRKLEMEYAGYRYPNCPISEEEREYIKNDVLVLKEALEMVLNSGNKKLTIGACCLSEFKKGYEHYELDELMPKLTEIPLDKAQYGSADADEYIRRAYRGGWCYVARGKERKIYEHGCTADVNSLYPSMMHSQSGNKYPVGKPYFWTGDFIPNVAQQDGYYYFVRVRFRFDIKDGYLPFIQIKRTFRYRGNVSLETSDFMNEAGQRSRFWTDDAGRTHDTHVILTFTCTDWELIKEHYHIHDCEILDGCFFQAQSGLFDKYIDKYKKQKQESKGAQRQLAKLYLNNLYGKMATSKNSSFKIIHTDETEKLCFREIPRADRKPVYIPIGAAITSYARRFTIKAAQANYHGPDKAGFIYADTDSIHCDLKPDEVQGINVHPTEFCCWKLESEWDIGFFTRQKTYIEHVIKEDGEPCVPFYDIKCAGMGQKCKALFKHTLTDAAPETFAGYAKLKPAEQEFLNHKHSITDFDVGLQVPGKLMPKQIPGGVVLVDTTFELR